MTEDTNTNGVDIERRSVLAATAGGLTAGVFGLSSTATAAESETEDGSETVTIIHDTHFHGRFQDSDVSTKDIVA